MNSSLAVPGPLQRASARLRTVVSGVALAVLAAGCSSRSFENPSGSISNAPQFGAIKGVVQLTGGGHDYSTLLPNVEIALTEPNGIQLYNQVDGQGLFTIGSLAAGTYSVLVTVNAAPGQSQLFAPFSVSPITVAAGMTTDLANLSPSYTGSSAQVRVEGFVHTDFHGDAGAFTFDGGFDLTGTEVDLFFAGDDSSPYLTTFTDSAGSFGYLLPPGTYDIKATNALFVTGTELDVPVGITPDGGILTGLQTLPQPIVLALNPARLGGVVTEEVDLNLVDAGAGDGGGFVPAPGVGLSTDFGGVGLTGPDGSFTINNLLGEPDKLHLAPATGMGGDTYHAEFDAYDVTLVPGDLTTIDPSKEPLRLLLNRGTITGKVQTADGSSVAAATVSLAFTSLAATIAPEGNPAIGDFSIANVPVRPGYTVNVTAPHFISTTATVPASFVGDGAVVDIGTIIIAPQQGDFTILSTNLLSKPGYTNTLAVDIQLDGAPSGATQIRIAESSSFSAGDGGTVPWTSLVTTSPYNPFTLANYDGAHTVYAQYQTPAGNGQPANPGPLLTGTVFADRVRPVNAAVSINGGEFQKIATGIALSLSASDGTGQSGLASMLVAQDFTGADYDGGLLAGTPGPYSTSGSFPPSGPQLADGLYTIYAQFFDNAGNASAIVMAPVVVDTVVPTGTLSITSLTASDLGYTSSALVVLNELFGWPDGGLSSTTTEPYGGVETVRLANVTAGSTPSSVGGPALAAAATQTWALDTSSGDGTKQVAMQIVDAAGNVSSVVQATITLLRTAPAGSVNIEASSTAGPASVNPAATDQARLELVYDLPSTANNPGATGVEVSEDPVACSSIPAAQYIRVTGSPMTVPYTFAGSGTDGGGIEDGNKVLFSCLRNAAGNTTQLENQIVLNREDPTATVTVGDGDTFQNDGNLTTVDLSGVSSDVVGVEVSTSPLSCDGGTYQPFIPADPIVQVSTPTDGSYTVYLCLEDSAGNETALGPYTFTRDTATPAITSATWTNLSDDAANATNSLTTGVELSVGSFSGVSPPVPIVVGYRLSTDQTFGAGSQPFVNFSSSGTPVSGAQAAVPFTLPAGDGTDQVYAQVIDLAGNISTPATALPPLKLIQAQPTATTDIYVGAIKDPAYTAQANITLQFTVSANVTQVSASGAPLECSTLPASSWQSLAGSPPSMAFTLSGSGNPSQTESIYVCFRDPADNYASTLNTITFDTQTPVATMVVGDGAAYQNVSGNVPVVFSNFEANTTGVVVSTTMLTCSSATYSAFNISNPVSSVNVGTTSATDGPYTAYACLKDAAGNFYTLPSFSFTKDTVSPTGSIVITGYSASNQALTNGYTASPTVQLTLTSSATTGKMQVSSSSSFTGASWQPFQSNLSWALPTGDGAKTVYVQYLDLAGNVSSTFTASVTLDTTPPSSATASYVGLPTSGSMAYAKSAAVTLAVAAIDTGGLSPTAAVTVASDTAFLQVLAGPEAIPGNGQVPFTLASGDGAKSVYVRFLDSAGNSTVVSAPVTLETAAPSGSISLLGTLGDGVTTSSTLTATTAVKLTLTASAAATGVDFGNETLTTCPTSAASYSAVPSGTINYTLTGSAAPRVVNACLTDGAGNTTLITASITLDTTAPSGCTLTLTGVGKNGVSPPAGRTASSTITVGVAGCSSTPASLALSTSALTCSGSGVPWQSFAASQSFSLPGSDGTYTVFACVRDAALNTAAAANSPTMQLTQTAPQPSSFTINAGAVYLNAAQAAASSRAVTVAGAATNAVTWAVKEGSAPTSGFAAIGSGSQQLTLSAGDGLKTVYGEFLDAVGNESSPISTSITVDTTLPTGGPLTVTTYQSGGFVSSVSATATLTSVGTATEISVVAVSGSSCTSGNGLFTDGGVNGQEVPAALSVSALLPSTDGTKTVCAQLIDVAGNVSSVLSNTVTLDTTPPTAPIITTANTTVNTPTGGSFVVQTAGAVTELNFAGYQQEGGQTSSWTTTSTTQNTTSFTFTLNGNVSNQLSLRAIDKAGNVSPQSSVFVTSIVTAPSAVTMNQTWLFDENGSAQVFWQDSSTTNLAGFYVYYDSSSHSGTTNYRGDFASEGPSPIFVPLVSGTSFSLDLQGLTNGAYTYVAVRAVDEAGNLSAAPNGTAEVVLEPNLLAMNPLSSLSISSGSPYRLATDGDNLYVLSSSGALPDAGGATTLSVISEGPMTSPIQTGSVQTSLTGPSLTTSQTFYDGLNFNQSDGESIDLKIDGPFAYAATGAVVRIINITNPAAPSTIDTLNFAPFAPYQPSSVAVLGDKLFVGLAGSNSVIDSRVVAVDLSKLFDRNASTTPTVYADGGGDVIGVQVNSGSREATGLGLWGNYLMFTGDAATAFNIVSAMGSSPTWPSTSAFPNVQYELYGSGGDPQLGGNYVFATGNGGLDIFDTSSLAHDGGLTLVSSSAYGGNGQLSVGGSEAFTNDYSGEGVHVLDVSTPSVVANDGLDILLPGPVEEPQGNVLLGNYLAEVYGYPQSLELFEVASPTRLNLVTQVKEGAVGLNVTPDLLLSGDGEAFDLASSPALNNLGFATYTYGMVPNFDLECPYDATWLDTTLVQAQGGYEPDGGNGNYAADGGYTNYLAVLDMRNALDRDPTTTFSLASNGYVVPFSAGTRATGVKAFGNYLLVAELRSPGVYLEVFDARKLRSDGTRQLTTSDSLGAIQLAGSFSDDATSHLSLSVHEGFAVVTFEEPTWVTQPSSLNGAGAWIVDVRPLMVDSSTSTLSASDVVATLALTNARGSSLHGNYLYIATTTGLSILNVASAFSAPPLGSATTPASAQVGFLSISDADSVDVWGSYALVAPQDEGNPNDGVVAVDISNPTSPFAASFLPVGNTVASECVPNQVANSHTSIQVRGTRAYLSGQELTAVISLH